MAGGEKTQIFSAPASSYRLLPLYQARYELNHFDTRQASLEAVQNDQTSTRPTLARQDAPYPKQGRK